MVHKNKISPPKFASWLLQRFLIGNENVEKLGDLEEGFWIKKEESGLLNAKFWYWLQVILTIPVCIKNIFNWGGIMFGNYAKIAIRNIKKYKGYSTINILGLAIGMACCILILLWVQDELSFDKFHENSKNLYRVTVYSEDRTGVSSPWALVPTLKKDFPEFALGTRYMERRLSIKYNDLLFYEYVALVDQEFLEMFTFPFTKGSPETALSNINSVIISEKIAFKYFGNEDPIGKTITMGNQIDYTVTAIIENVPFNSHMDFDLLIRPEGLIGEKRMSSWSMDCPSYVMLNAGVDVEKLTQKISGTIIKYDKRTNHSFRPALQPLEEIHLYSFHSTDPVVYVYLFSGIAILVLLIACINFMNLTTARSTHRAKEIGMRKVIGAEKKDIIKQFFGESIILSFIALFIAIVTVYLFLPTFNDLSSKQLTLGFINNRFLLIGMFIIALITGLFSGTYPAIYLSSFKPVTVLKNSIAKGSKLHNFRRALIIFQFSTAIILIIATSVILKQMSYMRTKDLGFNRDQIVRINLDRSALKKYEPLKKELLKDSDIMNVTSASSIPLRIGNMNPVRWEGRAPEDYEFFNFVCVDYDYFETFEMEMSYGRSFSNEFQTDSVNYIINEEALKMTGYDDPVGKMFAMWRNEGNIIGIVKDFNSHNLRYEINPIVFLLYDNLPKNKMFIKINSNNIPGTLEKIETTIKASLPNFIFEYSFLDDDFNYQYKTEVRLASLLEYFTFLAIFISCLGLLGLASFSAEQKSKEIAIRKVLGATSKSIVTSLSKEFVMLVVIANIIAWPIAFYFMNNWINEFEFRTEIGIGLFFIAGLIAVAIALVTVSFQAFKAASKNPVDNLRSE